VTAQDAFTQQGTRYLLDKLAIACHARRLKPLSGYGIDVINPTAVDHEKVVADFAAKRKHLCRTLWEPSDRLDLDQ
jgi:hypothetical protein